MPHSPHTISSSTISSVATNTSRVSPTLCHILGGGRRSAPGCGAAGAGGPVARAGLQRRAPGAAERRGDKSGGRPSAAPPGGGAGRCGGVHRGRPARRTLLRSRARGARGKARRRAPLPPHRSGEPGTRRPETPATAGCASMADAARPWTGERASTGTRGGHTALVAVRPGGWGWDVRGGVPRPAGTAANVSRQRPQQLLDPSPLPQ